MPSSRLTELSNGVPLVVMLMSSSIVTVEVQRKRRHEISAAIEMIAEPTVS